MIRTRRVSEGFFLIMREAQKLNPSLTQRVGIAAVRNFKTRQRGIFLTMREAQELNPSLTQRVGIVAVRNFKTYASRLNQQSEMAREALTCVEFLRKRPQFL